MELLYVLRLCVCLLIFHQPAALCTVSWWYSLFCFLNHSSPSFFLLVLPLFPHHSPSPSFSVSYGQCLTGCLFPCLYPGAVSGCRCVARVQAPGTAHPQVDSVALQPLQGGVGLAHPAAGHLHRHPDTLLSCFPPQWPGGVSSGNRITNKPAVKSSQVNFIDIAQWQITHVPHHVYATYDP